MPEKDYYKTLGVARDASQKQLRNAYRRLAKKHHPDRQGGSKAAEERFKEITEAYQVLSDPKRRAQYDQLREAGMHGGFAGFEDLFGSASGAEQRGRARGFSVEDLTGAGGGIYDLFSRVFGGRGASAAGQTLRQRGRDIRTRITIPFHTAANGGKVEVRVPRQQACTRCGGSGAAPGSKPNPCPLCGGTGQIQTGQGGFSIARPCPQCFGRGRVIQSPCAVCGGTGTSEQPTKVEVKIPRGVGESQRMRLAGMGQPGTGGAPPGDLIIEVNVQKHPRFERKGLDIYSQVSIGMVEAALGTEVEVQTLSGTVALRVPAGTQPEQKLRIKGHGIKGSNGRQGHHYVRVRVAIPTHLTKHQRELLREFNKIHATSSG